MDKIQLQNIIDNFDEYENIDIKKLMAIKDNEILDIIIKCNMERKKILVDMFYEAKDYNQEDPSIDVYQKIADTDLVSTAEFMAKVYALLPFDNLVFEAENCIKRRTRELVIKVLENKTLHSANITVKADITTKIMNEENEEKQEVLVDFLCDPEIARRYFENQIVYFFRQLNAMEDIEKCKALIEHIKTIELPHNAASSSIFNMIPKEIIEEPIDANKKEDLEKLVRMLEKTEVLSVSDDTSELIGRNGIYFKTKIKTSKNDK